MADFRQCVTVFSRLQKALSCLVDYPNLIFKPKQIMCFEYLLNGRDVIGVLPTGFGKSVLFQLLPDFLPNRIDCDDNIVIVAMPLNAIIDDQITNLTIKGISNCVLRTRSNQVETPLLFPRKESECQEMCIIPDEICNGRYKIVLCHPEDLLSTEGRNILKGECYQKRVAACVIDEAHCIELWGDKFREEYSHLSALKSFFPKVPFLALTATAPLYLINSIKKSLLFRNPVIIRKNPNRENVYLEKKTRLDVSHGERSYEEILKPIAEGLKDKLQEFPQTIIYMRLKYCGYASKLFDRILGNLHINGERLFAQFHAPQTSYMKAKIISDMMNKNSIIRVIFATSALGMGVNMPYISQVIHIGPPSTLEAYVQEIGRSGRITVTVTFPN